jgi:hypothetical protein
MKPGSRWRSVVCDTEVVVVKAPADAGAVTIECGGHPMVPIDADRPEGLVMNAEFAGGTPIGKRYSDEDSGLELLASKGGNGTLGVNGVALPMKGAKPLPSSD